ncbi:DUF2637 domain-containing protein [Streptomyces sp. NRRL S-350]|uniref:DUF2637 domain-containing protein n=1 Tax=Streptomyces sp. NRRL S-350 TaxID=1463902 RepID=UPI0006914F14|nr:DUF2637 domain-containing protein [Streptomyces sp. NRRL S-350]
MTAGSSSTVLRPSIPPAPAPARARVKWTRGRKALFGAIGAGSLAIATAGFVGSYTAVRALAEEKGFGSFAPAFPLAVDLGIAVLLALDLALTSVNLKYPLLRYIAWLLTAATIFFNAASSWPDVLGSAMHGTIPVLFIAVTEAMRNAIAKATDLELDQHMDSIRLSRWFLQPVATFSIWRDMKLWEIRSYALALERYQEKMLLRQDMRAKYGRGWRRKATSAELRPLRQARLGIAIDRSTVDITAPAERQLDEVPAPAAVEAAPPVPPAVEAPATAPPVNVPAAVPPMNVPAAAPPVNVPAAVPALAVLPATAPPVNVPLAVPPATAPVPAAPSAAAPAVPLPGDPQGAVGHAPAGAPEESGVGQEQVPDPESEGGLEQGEAPSAPEPEGSPAPESGESKDEDGDEEDDEAADTGVEEPKVNLGVAPPGETKVQRAERIYLAHQEAGVELTKPNLARWAGYQQEGSGRTQYNKLEKKHGPIVVREGADQLDLDWRDPAASDEELQPARQVL